MQKGFALLIVLIGVFVIVGLVFGGYWFLNQSKPAQEKQIATTATPSSIPAPSSPTLTESNTIDQLNPSATIKIPFVRNESIYLYEDGKEKLVAKPQQASTEKSCYSLVYPFLSPNGKYLAYVEQVGDKPGMGGCWGGILRIVNLDSGEDIATNYNTTYFKWNESNQIVFSLPSDTHELGKKSTAKQVFYDPATNKELMYKTIIDIASNGAQTLSYGEYPFNPNKQIRYEDKKYFLLEGQNRKLIPFSVTDDVNFQGWSPDGTYALFTNYKANEGENVWVSIDTRNSNLEVKEIFTEWAGGAGGEPSTGIKWYFNKGFVIYCDQKLYFVDGSKPLELTNDGGGGCHNEEGFVATSPNGEFAFVKFKDRFEINTKNGEKKVISETIPLAKGRFVPKNLVWVNNDYMAIFERTTNADYGAGKPKIYLFDRKANVVKPLIENAYLNSSVY